MAITRLTAANAISGTLPAANINDTSIGNITALPAAIATGKVLQVVEGTSTTEHVNTEQDDQDIGLSVSITPTSSSNKILVVASFLYKIFDSGSAGSTCQFALLRGSTSILSRSGSTNQDYNVEASALSSNNYMTMATTNTMQILDSPSTTSATTYKIQSSCSAHTTTTKSMHNGVRGSITAYEVSA